MNITTVDWPYRDEDTALTGVLCRDEALRGTRPGVLLVHGGAGLDDSGDGQDLAAYGLDARAVVRCAGGYGNSFRSS